MSRSIYIIENRLLPGKGSDIFRRGYKAFALKIFCLLIISLIFAGLSSCSDKDIIDSQYPGSGYDDPDGITLSFMVDLGEEAETRDDSDPINMDLKEGNIDNYVKEGMMQVFFLDKDGNFMFQPKKEEGTLDIQESPDNNGQWYLTVYLNNNFKDTEGNSILSLIKNQMEKAPYKIAVLANWRLNKEDKLYSIDWGWDNSILNSAAIAPKNINDLHHIEEDSHYKDTGLSFVSKNGLMGVDTNWVDYRDISGKEMNGDPAWKLEIGPDNSTALDKDAFVWIRNNWDPALDNNISESMEHRIYRHYSKLWMLWNFGGDFDDTAIPYNDLGVREDPGRTFQTAWKGRNATGFKNDWLANDNTTFKNEEEVDGLIVITDGTKGQSNDSQVRSYKKTGQNGGKGYYGILLPQVNQSDLNPKGVSNGKPWLESQGKEYLEFLAIGTGHLRVLFSSLDGSEASLVVQRGSNWEMTYTISGNDIMEIGDKDGVVSVFDPDKMGRGHQLKLTENTEYIKLFALKGNIVVYAIEYVCDDYLDGTDREGIIPDKDHPIPMYGVNQYPRIDAWGSVRLLTLPDILYMIRSVAKVELYLPKGTEISHAYLRSMNRKSRCEPMDLLTDTGSLWGTHIGNTGDCEWFRLQDHGVVGNDFNSWFGWFFGSWKSWWTEFAYGDANSPHLFNPDVERSDFCHFIKDEKYNDGIYHRYFLYVPDKNISDPNDAAKPGSSPKVCHIEYRHTGQSDYLDDNECYRIYFTDYSTNDVIKGIKPDEYESKYEEDPNNLKLNWPIMRNHIYRFYVGGNNSPQEIRVKVKEWGSTVPKIYEW